MRSKARQEVKKHLLLGLMLGMVYYTIEGVWRMPGGGRAHIAMLLVGGICGVLIGFINQIPRFFHLPIWAQSLIGTVVTLVVELISGCILNLWLGLGIWDYSGSFLNIKGQVCVAFGLIWYCIMPLAIWMDDTLRWYGWQEGRRYSLKSIYKELILGR